MIKLWGESPACDKPWIVSYFNWHQPKAHWSGSQMKHEVFNVGNVGWNQHEMIGKTLDEIWQIGSLPVTIKARFGNRWNDQESMMVLMVSVFFSAAEEITEQEFAQSLVGTLNEVTSASAVALNFWRWRCFCSNLWGSWWLSWEAVGGDGPGPMSKAWCEGSKSSWIGGEKKSCCQPATWNSESSCSVVDMAAVRKHFLRAGNVAKCALWGVDTFVILQKVDGSARLYQAQGQAEVGHCIVHWCS